MLKEKTQLLTALKFLSRKTPMVEFLSELPSTIDQDHCRLIDYCQAERRVCPQPMDWRYFSKLAESRFRAKAHRLLPEEREMILQEGQEFREIKIGWGSTDDEKMERLNEQLRFLSKYDFTFEFAESYLRGLMPEQWHYKDRYLE